MTRATATTAALLLFAVLVLPACRPAETIAPIKSSRASELRPTSAEATSVEARTAADEQWLNGDALADPSWTDANPSLRSGITWSVTGTVIAMGEWAATGALILYVDTGAPRPVCVVLNEHTRLTWPAAWGKVAAESVTDPPAVRLPSSAPALTGRRFVGTVQTLRVVGNRDQAFAVEARLE